MTKFKKRKCFDIESFWHSFGIWILTFELFQVSVDLFRIPIFGSKYKGKGRIISF
jgi:hypothetical protein